MAKIQLKPHENIDTAGGKKTMTAYLWSVCGAAYDQEHGA